MGITTGFVIFSIALCISGIIAVILSTKKGAKPAAATNTPGPKPASTGSIPKTKSEKSFFSVLMSWIAVLISGLVVITLTLVMGFVIFMVVGIILSGIREVKAMSPPPQAHAQVSSQKIVLEQGVWSERIRVPNRMDLDYKIDPHITYKIRSDIAGIKSIHHGDPPPHIEGNWVEFMSPNTNTVLRYGFIPQ